MFRTYHGSATHVNQHNQQGRPAGNVLDKMPQSVRGRAQTMLREMRQAPALAQATSAYDQLFAAWAAKYPQAVACLRKDEESLFSFYAFPAEHWIHLRTSNPIESRFCHRMPSR